MRQAKKIKIRNPKSEIRNKFEYQMTKIPNGEVFLLSADNPFMFGTFENLNFDIVSDFEFRASNLKSRLNKKYLLNWLPFYMT